MLVATTQRLLADGDEVTVLLPAAGAPPRSLRLARWRTPTGSSGAKAKHRTGAGSRVELVLPAGAGVRRRMVDVELLELGDVIDELIVGPPSLDATESVRSLAHAVGLAVDLVARGRLLPSISGDGTDAWRLGPLDPDDHRARAQLAGALAPALHATVVPGASPLRIASPEAVLVALGDAVADVLVRTAGAAIWGRAFAVEAPTDVSAASGWLAGTATGGEHDVTVALRLEPPGASSPEDGLGGCAAVLQVHSVVDPSLVIDAAEVWEAPEVVLARLGADVEATLLLALRRGGRVWPPLRRLLDDAAPTEIVLDDEEANDLLGPVTDDLASAGIQVLWPRDLVRTLGVAATVSTTESPEAVTGSMFHFEDLMELRFTVSLDGEVLTDEELDALAQAKRTVVRLRGQWVRADPELLARAAQRQQIAAGAALGLALGGTLEVGGTAVPVEVDGPLGELSGRLRSATAGPRELSPSALQATLRPYQRRGIAWLAEMSSLGLGGVLADDMGLGKTIQLLALHLARRDGEVGGDAPLPGPTLVVCPVTLIANWEREAHRFAPDVVVHRFHGPERTLDGIGEADLVLTTYGVVRRDAESLASVAWGLVVADEAQAVKNPLARTARQLRTIDAQARFALTGTPVENRLSELWALLDWTTPGLLGPLDRFRHEVAAPIERTRDPEVTEALARLVRPFVLRRRKIDPEVLTDLPPKTETDRMVLLTTEQATLYRALSAEILERIEDTDGIARRGLIFKLLSGLKQICDHPALFLDQDAPLHGRSGKLAATLELLDLVVQEGDAALLFTQYVGMGKLLERCLIDAGMRVAFLHGKVPLKRRQEMVDALQARELDVLLLSLKAGGTGLNLTAATHVVHYDRWWNPAVEDQASDRAWRIGQDRPVQVHRMVCEGTLEERIAEMLESKRALAEAVVGTGEGWITELDDDALRALVALSGDVGGADDAPRVGGARR